MLLSETETGHFIGYGHFVSIFTPPASGRQHAFFGLAVRCTLIWQSKNSTAERF